MTTASHLKAVVEFLSIVANATPPVADIEPRIKTTAVVLAETLPVTAMFCRDSAIYVALEAGFFPSAAKAKALVEKWWESHRPPSLPSAAASATMPDADRPHVDAWLRARSAGKSERDLADRLAIVRRFAPDGFAWLVANDAFVAGVAHKRCWIREHEAADAVEPERKQTPQQQADVKADDGVVSVNRSADPEQPQGPLRSPMSDADLLAKWEAEPTGKIRADAIRRRIAVEALKTAKPSDWKPYVTPGAIA